jgi:pimaricinolide synthase PimS1
MDPQQRLLLEASWEALEGAGIDPATLRGSETGVFAGAMYHDYTSNLGSLPKELYGYIGMGNSGSVMSGRVSYTFGFEGPAMTVDTACSSSLVALHLACLSLSSGDCSLALAGGVTVLATPSGFIEFSQQRNLAADGRCKPFSDSADGASFSEGVGLLLLERLSDARRNGHTPLAIVRGSAVNQDGASNGLAAPNGPSQERVIMQALANAGVSPAQVDAVEAHGTGTTLGDPIEAQALLAVYGAERTPDRPLWLGAVKSNIGHTQAAAGVAGVIKMVKALEHRVLPKTLYVDSPSTYVDWSVGGVSLLQESRAWEREDRPRRAGISSFGVSGTNAHVLLEEAPAPIDAPAPPARSGGKPALALDGAVVAWTLSGKGEDGLLAQADRLSRSLREDPDVRAADVALSLSHRAAFDERAVVVGGDAKALLAGVAALAEESSAANVVRGSTTARSRAPVFVFGGQGSQWAGMGVKLLDQSPAFANRLRECDTALSHFIDWSVEDVLRGVDGAPELDRIEVLQPALFCVMVAAAELWRACGVEPAAVVGHSQGEIAAACVAGGLSLHDAARLVALRSGLLVKLVGRGSIASVAAGEADVRARISAWEGRLSIASVNSPSSVAVVGDAEAVAELLDSLAADGVRTREVALTVPTHSSHVEELRSETLELLSSVEPRAADVPFYSTVTGDLFDTAGLTSEYWYRNLREPVRFEQAVRALLRDGRTAFIETGPHPVLSIAVRETIEDALSDATDEGNLVGAADETVVCGSLRRDEGGAERFVTSLAQAWVGGVDVDWRGVCAREGAKRVSLPPYAFQRRRYWLRKEFGSAGSTLTPGGLPVEHGILGAVTRLAHDSGWLYSGLLSLDTHPWLADHAVSGTALLPGTGLLDLVLVAGRDIGGWGVVQELVLEAPLVVPQEGAVRIQMIVAEPDDENARSVELYSQIELASPDREERAEAPAWVRNASGRLVREDSLDSAEAALDAGSWPPAGAEEILLGDVYGRLADMGFEYGRAFQGLRRLWRHGGDLYCEAALEDSELVDAGSYEIHPALLDSALHAALVIALGEGSLGTGELRLPFCWERVRLFAAGASSLLVRIASAEQAAQAGDGEERRVSLLAVDRDGRPVASVGALSSRPIAADSLQAVGARPSRPLLGVAWSRAEPDADHGESSEWALIGAHDETSRRSIADAVGAITVVGDLDELSDRVAAGVLARVPDVVLLDARSTPVQEAALGAQSSAAAVAVALREWAAREQFATSRLLVLTEGALHVADGDEVGGLLASGICGLVRSAATEHPGRFALLDVDDLPAATAALPAVAAAPQAQLAIRAGELLAPRLMPLDAAHAPSSGDGRSAQDSLGPDCSVLITGGTGVLGATVARHLVSAYGVGCVILASRRGIDAPGAAELQQELQELGAEALVVSCDVSDRDSLAGLLEAVPPPFPLRGVVHAAGAIDDGLIGSLTDSSFASTFVPKAHAAWHLHELTQSLDLSMFVLFSSVAGVLGSPGQGNYAAANTFLDSLAAHRRARGLPAVSIAWGLWEQVSELTAELDDVDRTRMARGGVLGLSTDEALELFDRASVADSPALVIAARFDLAALRAAKRAEILPDVLSGLVRDRAARPQGRGVIARRLADAPEPEREALALELIRAEIAVVLGHESAAAIDSRAAFKDLGFDSLAAVELRNRLNVATGLALPATLVFDHPNAHSLAGHILHLLAPAPAQPLEAELDSLELALSRGAPEGSDAAKIAARLRSLLTQLDDGETSVEHVAVTEMIESASADEVFEFIDRELDAT